MCAHVSWSPSRKSRCASTICAPRCGPPRYRRDARVLAYAARICARRVALFRIPSIPADSCAAVTCDLCPRSTPNPPSVIRWHTSGWSANCGIPASGTPASIASPTDVSPQCVMNSHTLRCAMIAGGLFRYLATKTRLLPSAACSAADTWSTCRGFGFHTTHDWNVGAVTTSMSASRRRSVSCVSVPKLTYSVPLVAQRCDASISASSGSIGTCS
mmetsp:Transcript_35122/g.108418  ORF Transcript_35122/g.108418 Transcript_35122/m.108418 type:complete len:215 (-) Transcript_35122:1037-1681(-)